MATAFPVAMARGASFDVMLERRVGIAALRYDATAADTGNTGPLVALGGLSLLLGLFAAVFVAKLKSMLEKPAMLFVERWHG